MEFAPFFVYSFFAMTVGYVPMYFHKIIGPKIFELSSNSLKPYECGFDAIGQARMPFFIQFYVIAVLFVLFDLEMTFLFPWALIVKKSCSLDLLLSGWSFIFLLLAGLYYEWKKGVLS
jgi:NADH-quinone oxidoreductase subunit A